MILTRPHSQWGRSDVPARTIVWLLSETPDCEGDRKPLALCQDTKERTADEEPECGDEDNNSDGGETDEADCARLGGGDEAGCGGCSTGWHS